MRKAAIILFVVFAVGSLLSNSVSAQEKLGLLIIAHGSPMPQWNKPVLELEAEVREIFSEREADPFSEVRIAFMEFSEPSVGAVIKDLESVGIDRIYTIPLFIAPSGHSLYDIPTILGLYSDKEMVKQIKEEGAAIVHTKMKITLGPTLHTGDVLKEVMLDRVKELSTTPDSEGIVLLAHGDPRFEPIWVSVCREIGSYVCAGTGVKYFDYAFVGIGHSFISEGVPVILGMTKKCNKTIVVGLYLSMGVDNMAQNSTLNVGTIKIDSRKIFENKDIHFAKRGLLPDRRIARWIVDRAVDWQESLR